jgi:heterodisulfide reductase subunit A
MLEKAPQAIEVFLCDCGGGISRIIDFAKLQETASKLEWVKSVRRHSFLCGDEGKNEIKAAAKNGANRIVVAACSPKLYEPLFKQCLSDVGANPYLLEMANIREQCAWPHADNPEGATEKAQRVLASAIEKARNIEPIEEKEFEIYKGVLVIGAGVAGLQTAIDIADFGHKVTLIEKAPVVGGNALKLGLAFPADDGAFCISSPNFLPSIRKCFYRASLMQHPNLRIQTLAEVKEVKGSYGNFEVKVSSQPRGVKANLCTNCGKCREVCPVDVADEMNYGLSKRKAIYLPYPNAVPPVYVVDWKNCTKCGKCTEVCQTHAIDLNEESAETTQKVGAIVIATGFQEYDPSQIKRYQYGLDNNVITQLQLARILDPLGPTGGKLVKPSDGKAPERIVMIQCVGSRDTSTNPYCSKICCMLALKHAIFIKEEYAPNAEIYVCYMDVRTPGKGYEKYFSRARQLGVTFIRGKPSQILRVPADGKLVVEVEDTLLDMPLELEADMVVLTVAMTPTEGTKKLAETLRVETGNDGFVQEIYPKLKPVDTNVKGIYVCGGAQAPKDIPESITQADAVAFKVISDFSRDTYKKNMDIAFVKEEDCDGCKICVDVCPFDAPQLVEVEKVENETSKPSSVARIDELRCDKCGLCASRCPTGAIQLQHYTDDQSLSQIAVLLSEKTGSMSPKILAFCCDECGYATVDLAGMGGVKYPANVLPIRVPCMGWVSLYQIFKALEYGADGILLVGCKLENCQHLEGAVNADKVVTFAKEIMDEVGLNGNRLKMISVCAAEPTKFSATAESMVNEIKQLGPIGKVKPLEGNSHS